MAAALAARRADVVAVSPLIGGKAVKGPAAKIMAELGLKATPRAIAYAVVDDISVLLPDEGRSVDADELSELDAARASVVETGAGRS